MLKDKVEVDATSVRTVRVARKSQTFKAQIDAWKSKHAGQKMPPHFLVHFRVLGACERQSQRMVLKPAEIKVLPSGACPPQESTREIMNSGILHRVSAKTCCYADGCKAWPAAATKQVPGKRLAFKDVKHCKGQFVHSLGRKPRARGSSLAGTQTLARQWDWLKKSIPRSLKTFKESRKNWESFWLYLHAALWRKSLSREETLQKLGSLCRG